MLPTSNETIRHVPAAKSLVDFNTLTFAVTDVGRVGNVGGSCSTAADDDVVGEGSLGVGARAGHDDGGGGGERRVSVSGGGEGRVGELINWSI